MKQAKVAEVSPMDEAYPAFALNQRAQPDYLEIGQASADQETPYSLGIAQMQVRQIETATLLV